MTIAGAKMRVRVIRLRSNMGELCGAIYLRIIESITSKSLNIEYQDIPWRQIYEQQ